MKFKFWGTRGGIAAPSFSAVELGGNTTCLEVILASKLSFFIDSGTGIIEYANQAFRPNIDRVFHLLFTHFHWDHVQGFPFFFPIHFPNVEIHLYSPFPEQVLIQHLSDLFDGTYSPLKNINNLNSKLCFHQIPPEGLYLDGAQITFELTQHPEPCYAYRIAEQGKVLTFLTDHENNRGKINQNILKFVEGSTCLIHDGQYFEEEYLKQYIDWGHSSVDRAIENALQAEVNELLITHHDPHHSDDLLRIYLYRLKQKNPDFQKKLKHIDYAAQGKLYSL